MMSAMPRRTTRAIGENTARLAGMHLLTQVDLRRALGMSRQGISNLVLGRSEPTIATAQAVADFFGVTVADLLAGAQECLRAGVEAFEQAPARQFARARTRPRSPRPSP
jgi:transcriptional regulator with XRE-family HTH domain